MPTPSSLLRSTRAIVRSAVVFVLAGLAIAGCSTAPGASVGTSGAASGSGPAPTSGAAGVQHVSVRFTNAGCIPDPSSIQAGPVTFSIVNDGADRVSEVEILAESRMLGEKENLAPGMAADLTLELAAGSYTVACPGAATVKSVLTVTAAAAGASAGASGSSTGILLAQATAGYAEYVRGQVEQLLTASKAFTAAVEAGDVAKAKLLYGPARVYYERIEPVAESFGDLDPAIDGRIDGAATPADFTGFHRLEQALWIDASTAGMAPIAQKLIADIVLLQTNVATATYQPAQLANGASELLDEIAASKITGEEERYSRIDLLDFQGNLDGSRKAFQLLEPALRVTDAALADQIVAAFADVQKALDAYRSGEGFVAYTELTEADTKALAQKVDALAEPLSLVAAKIVGGT